VKIGNGSVVVGNINATSAVVAGAIKGDLDVKGPVIVDTTAVIVGNIKSKSVQINNGAVIEGFCSQAYSDVNVDDLFGKED
ncbi:MAG: polymer-forming cytoskeletal protein, partial [Eubacterium sp.]|nr:polymer-forming cytoskeletal protein [Eubacterium sp.]